MKKQEGIFDKLDKNLDSKTKFKEKKIELSVEIQNKLEQLNRKYTPSECAILGINLLYKNNCEIRNLNLSVQGQGSNLNNE